MPNLYNRPRPTLAHLLEFLRDRARVEVLLLLAALALGLLVGTSLDHLEARDRQVLAGRAAGNPEARLADLPWRYRAPAWVVTPVARVLAATRLFHHPEGGDHAFEAAATLVQAAAAAYALAAAVTLVSELGFKVGMCIRVGLLLLLTSCLGASAWRFGPAALLAAAVAGYLKNTWRVRVEPRPLTAARAAGWLLLGCVIDPVLVVLLPLGLAVALPPWLEERRPAALIASAAAVIGVLALHWGFHLRPDERAYVLTQLGIGDLVRRVLGAAIGTGSALLLAAPPVLLALLGAGRLASYDPRGARLTLGSAGLLLGTQLLLVRGPAELADPTAAYALLLPALAPAMAFGILRLKESPLGPALMTSIFLAGLTVQGSALLFDPDVPMRSLRAGKAYATPRDAAGDAVPLPTELVVLDRRFTPELSDPALSLACLWTWLDGQPALKISLPDATVPLDLLIDAHAMRPRPWVYRVLAWRPKDAPAPDLAAWWAARRAGRAPARPMIGDPSHGQRALAGILGLLFLATFVTAGRYLWIRLGRLANRVAPS